VRLRGGGISSFFKGKLLISEEKGTKRRRKKSKTNNLISSPETSLYPRDLESMSATKKDAVFRLGKGGSGGWKRGGRPEGLLDRTL